MHNPALQQFPRNQPAQVIPTQQGDSILEWLENSGRMMARESDEEVSFDFPKEDAEINELMGNDDAYDDDDDALDLDDD
ncbi:MAG: DUF3134 domain-containing protein [Synechococcales bacterium]|nr:DUF3134 domain-containing protein [Synechococcales bacterium]